MSNEEELSILTEQLSKLSELNLIQFYDEERYSLDQYFQIFDYLSINITDTNLKIEIFLGRVEPDISTANRFAAILLWCLPVTLPSNHEILENLKDLHPELQKFFLSNLDIIENDSEFANNRKWYFLLK